MDRNTMKAEAIDRMNILGIREDAVDDFINHDEIYISKGNNLLKLTDEQKDIVKHFEDDYNNVVYHCVESTTMFGKMFNMLFVSEFDEEWEYDRYGLPKGEVLAMVENITYPENSDMGTIGVVNVDGILTRIW